MDFHRKSPAILAEVHDVFVGLEEEEDAPQEDRTMHSEVIQSPRCGV
jgi:hypothetical protein